MTRKWWICGIAFGAAASLAASQFAVAAGRPSGGGSRPTFASLLSAFDANRDGVLAASEVPGQLWNRLKIADTNKDNVVTQVEFVAAGGKP